MYEYICHQIGCLVYNKSSKSKHLMTIWKIGGQPELYGPFCQSYFHNFLGLHYNTPEVTHNKSDKQVPKQILLVSQTNQVKEMNDS